MSKKYFHKSDYESQAFIPLPLVFQTDERYKGMCSDAKLLYGILVHRAQLSESKGWIDGQGRVYMYYSREDMASSLNVSLPTLRKAIRQLMDAELLEEAFQGKGKPNKLYLLQPDVPDRVNKQVRCNTDTVSPNNQNKQLNGNSQSIDSQPDSNKKDYVDSKLKEFDLRLKEIYDSVKGFFSQEGKTLSCSIDSKKDILKNSNNISTKECNNFTGINIHVDNFFGEDRKIAQMVWNITYDIMNYTGTKYRIGKIYYEVGRVKESFMNICDSTVKHVINALKSAGKVNNMRNYITAVIFNYSVNPYESSENNNYEKKPKNSFHDFNQRNYDYNKLMEQLGYC